MIQFILGVLLIVFSVFLGLKIIGDFLKALLIAFLMLIGLYLAFGYAPNIENFNIKSIFGLSIDSVGRDKEGNLLIFVKNKWFFEARNFTVYVDGSKADIANKIDKIGGRKSDIMQLDWNKDFSSIKIESNIGSAEYSKK